jgi:hypothetical protein
MAKTAAKPEIDEKEPEKTPETEPADDGGEETSEKPEVTRDDDGVVAIKPRGTRRERREARYDEVAAERDRFRTEAEATKRELEQFRARQAALEAQFAQQARSQQTQSQPDPFKERLELIRREQEVIQSQIRAGNLPEADLSALKKRFYELDDARDEVKEERILARAQSRRPERDEGAEIAETLAAEFPEVVNNKARAT